MQYARTHGRPPLCNNHRSKLRICCNETIYSNMHMEWASWWHLILFLFINICMLSVIQPDFNEIYFTITLHAAYVVFVKAEKFV